MIKKSARDYCRKDEFHLIENYEEAKASPDVWECHHRLELTLDGKQALSYKDLIRHNMYYNRPAFELIFLNRNEHKQLHWNASSNERHLNASKKLKHMWIKNYKGYSERLTKLNKIRATDPIICEKLKLSTTAIMADPVRKQVFLDAQKIKKDAYRKYKVAGGTLSWNDWARDIYKYREGSSTNIKLKRRSLYESLNKEKE